jgi:UDP-N-acetylglucosamine 2-epimerase (non-hydrolysing)
LYRRIITRLATEHFAATDGNRETLIREGISPDRIFVTGNPVIDTLEDALALCGDRASLPPLARLSPHQRLLVLTCHRRESFGARLERYLTILRRFVERHDDIALVFPVHPNPAVRNPVGRLLAGAPRVHLIEPLGYLDFIALLSQAWLIASDSGGIQEEVPTLGKPLLILRENTERPEVIEAGVARLVGHRCDDLDPLLEEAVTPPSWLATVRPVDNPFGRGDSGQRIASILVQRLTGGLHGAREAGLRPESAVTAPA